MSMRRDIEDMLNDLLELHNNAASETIVAKPGRPTNRRPGYDEGFLAGVDAAFGIVEGYLTSRTPRTYWPTRTKTRSRR